MINLYEHQIAALKATSDQNRVAYYLDMGLGKTFVGSEKMMQLNYQVNLIICQKSKIQDWMDHFQLYDSESKNDNMIFDLTYNRDSCNAFVETANDPSYLHRKIGIINYELAWRRPELSKLKNFTLMLDESSFIQNDCAKQSKFILNKLHPANVILLSGTPTSGRYERLWSQMHLIGWTISKKMYYAQYIEYERTEDGYPIITGYKNVDRLKRKMRDHGCIFMKSDEVFNLPAQIFIPKHISETKEYKSFMKDGIIDLPKENITLVGDTILTKMLYARMLCGVFNAEKVAAFTDLIKSTEDRVIVFYNFKSEYELLKDLIIECGKPVSTVNGSVKDLKDYEESDNTITLVQYQAGARGLNLQKANKIIYFTPTLSSELFEQSKKRIHRIGQNTSCFYYKLVSGIESKIYKTLDMRKDYTDNLFKEEINS